MTARPVRSLDDDELHPHGDFCSTFDVLLQMMSDLAELRSKRHKILIRRVPLLSHAANARAVIERINKNRNNLLRSQIEKRN
jgi:hypothetical protein